VSGGPCASRTVHDETDRNHGVPIFRLFAYGSTRIMVVVSAALADQASTAGHGSRRRSVTHSRGSCGRPAPRLSLAAPRGKR
jgi:hypothetical protein